MDLENPHDNTPTMNNLPSNRTPQFVIFGLVLALIVGCAGLLPKPAPQPAFYALDGVRAEKKAVAPPLATAPTLIVNPPHAAAGFDSQRIIYVRDAHKLDYFARSEWIDTPARMLTPLIVAAIENGGAFRAVVQTPSPAAGDIRLDTEILRLQHNFTTSPSSVRFTLRAYLVDNATRRVLASREFDTSEVAASEDPYGGVVAANRAVQSTLEKLAGFCAETALSWQPQAAEGAPRR